MSAYLIVHATPKDPEKLQEYAAKAGPTVQANGGEVVTRTQVTEVLAGSHDHKLCIIIRFPDGAALRRWYQSEDYQALVPLRNEAIEATFIIGEEPTG